MRDKLPEFSYTNILSVCALFSSAITAKEIYFDEFGQDSFALVPAFTAMSLCVGKGIYDKFGYSKPFLFGSLTVMAYTLGNVFKGCSSLMVNDRLSGIIGTFILGQAISIIAGVITHEAYELAKYLDGDGKSGGVTR